MVIETGLQEAKFKCRTYVWRLSNVGGTLGPSMTGVGSKLTRGQLIEGAAYSIVGAGIHGLDQLFAEPQMIY